MASTEVEDIVASCLEREESEWSSAIDEACRSNPSHAKAIREVFEAISRVSGMRPLVAVDVPSMELPERLGDFRLEECLGAGGMGVVYRAIQESLDRPVALKLVRPEHLFFPSARQRFQREVQAIANLSHTGIVPVYAFGVEGSLPFFAMELIDGCTLDDVIRHLESRRPEELTGRDLFAAIVASSKSKNDDADQAPSGIFDGSWTDVCCRLIRQAASALEHAHGRGVLHRDVKPSNLMVTRHGRVMLVDFGLASIEGGTKVTRSESHLGSYPYMAPEHLDSQPTDERADIYSLAVTLFELLTLRSPFMSSTQDDIRRRILAAEHAPMRQLNPSVSADLETVCSCAMSLDREKRYRTAADFDRDLGNVLGNRDIEARRVTHLERLWRKVRRRPSVATAALLGVILVIVVPTAFLFVQSSHVADLNRVIREKDLAMAEAETASVESARIYEFIYDLFVLSDPSRSSQRRTDMTVREAMEEGARKLRTEKELEDQPLVRASLFEALGRVYGSIGDHVRAGAMLDECLKLRQSLLPPNHPQIAKCISAMGQIESDRGRADLAVPLFERAIAMLDASGIGRTPERFEIVRALACALPNTDRIAEADARIAEGIAIGTELDGELSPLLVTFDILKAGIARAQSRYVEAESIARAAWERYRAKHGDFHPVVVELENQWSDALTAAGRDADALQHIRHVIERETAIFGDKHLVVARSYARLARCLTNLERLDEAQEAALHALTATSAAIGKENQRYVQALGVYGEFLTTIGKTKEAAATFDEALATWERVGGSSQGTATILIHRSSLALAANDIPLAKECLAKAERLIDGDDTSKANLGALRMVQSGMALTLGDREHAKTLIGEAIAIFEPMVGRENRRIGSCLAQLGEIHCMENDFEAAEACFRRALAIYESAFGKTSLYVADAKARLSRALYPSGRLDQAESELVDALEIYDRSGRGGQESPGLIGAKLSLSTVYYHKGKFHECLALTESIMDVVPALFANDPVRVGNVQLNLLDARREVGALDGLEEAIDDLIAKVSARAASDVSARLLVGRAEVVAARVAAARGRLDSNMTRARRGLAELRSILGSEHAMVGEAEGEVGLAYVAADEDEEAEELLISAVEKLSTSRLGHRQMARLVEALASLYERMSMQNEADRWRRFLESRRIAESRPVVD